MVKPPSIIFASKHRFLVCKPTFSIGNIQQTSHFLRVITGKRHLFVWYNPNPQLLKSSNTCTPSISLVRLCAFLWPWLRVVASGGKPLHGTFPFPRLLIHIDFPYYWVFWTLEWDVFDDFCRSTPGFETDLGCLFYHYPWVNMILILPLSTPVFAILVQSTISHPVHPKRRMLCFAQTTKSTNGRITSAFLEAQPSLVGFSFLDLDKPEIFPQLRQWQHWKTIGPLTGFPSL